MASQQHGIGPAAMIDGKLRPKFPVAPQLELWLLPAGGPTLQSACGRPIMVAGNPDDIESTTA